MTGVSVPNYLAAVRGAGWAGDILMATILPRANLVTPTPQKEAERQAYNATLRTAQFHQANGLLGISDIADDPTFGAAGAANDNTLTPDGTHWNDLGTSFQANAHAEAINPRLSA
jgi:hypothetical protein